MKKIITIILSLAMLTAAVSCNKSSENEKTEVFNNFYEVPMEDEAIYLSDSGLAYIVDYETLETSLLCNIPNCTHMYSDCIVSALDTSGQLPIIYEDAAYYFVNSSSFKDEDGKRVLDLKTKLMKYDFEKAEISEFAGFEDVLAGTNGGMYLIGSEMYFLTTYGNPKYDEVGNVESSSSGGNGSLFSINLDTAEYCDYGEVFDYEALKAEVPLAKNSTSMSITGKIGNELYISVAYLKNENAAWSGFTYTFNLETKEYRKINDYFSCWNHNGYRTYLNNGILYISPEASEEYIAGPEVASINTVRIHDDKVWCEESCYDIKSGMVKPLSEVCTLRNPVCVGVFEGDYIVKGTNDEEKKTFERISAEELDKLFK